MASSFIEKFLSDVDANLDDPSTSKRVTADQKLRLLATVEKRIWEQVLMLTGGDSVAGYCEADITIESGKEFYLLPGNFRQFLNLIRYQNEDRGTGIEEDRLGSIGMWDDGPGVIILSEQRGMRMKPMPSLNASQRWVMSYLKGPVVLHYATTSAVTDKTIKAGTVGTNAGSLVLLDDYYNGSLLGVYNSDQAGTQIREIVDWDAASRTFHLRHAWNPKPTGTIKYEVRPILPPDYDDLYAMDVAIRILGRRRQRTGRRGLVDDRSDLWNACKGYYLSNVADRAPVRSLPPNPEELDPYD